ncbi:hypothetical protein ACWGF2_20505 [Streptomyces sp. NPDC054919]
MSGGDGLFDVEPVEKKQPQQGPVELIYALSMPNNLEEQAELTHRQR